MLKLLYPRDRLPLSVLSEYDVKGFREQHRSQNFHGISDDDIARGLAASSLIREAYSQEAQCYFPFDAIIDPLRCILGISRMTNHLFCAVLHDRIVAVGSILPEGHESAEFGRMVVSSELRGAGLAHQIIAARHAYAMLVMKLKRYYCSSRAASEAIIRLWGDRIKYPAVCFGADYAVGRREFTVTFMKAIKPVLAQQCLSVLPEFRYVVQAVCEQFSRCKVTFSDRLCSVQPHKPVTKDCIQNTKYFVQQLSDLPNGFLRDDHDYVEVHVDVSDHNSLALQSYLAEQGFICVGFIPAQEFEFSVQSPRLIFGHLKQHVQQVRQANLSPEFKSSLIGQLLESIHQQFLQGREDIQTYDPFSTGKPVESVSTSPALVK